MNKNLFLIQSIIISIYVIFMLNFFKTKYSIAHPVTYFKNSYLYHPIKNVDTPRNMICKMGNHGAWFMALFIILRAILLINIDKYNISVNTIKLLSKTMVICVFILTFLNFNAMLYLVPYFLFEIQFLYNL